MERRLRESGMTYTIVRPSFFMDVWLSPHAGFDPVGGQVRIYGSGDAPVSLVSAADVAAYVAECVEIAVVTQGRSIDDVLKNLLEAVHLHLEGEDLAAFGLGDLKRIHVSFELPANVTAA